MSEAEITAESAPPAYLVIREGSRWTDVFSLVPGRQITIGRASSCHIVIRDERCSRRHAELFVSQSGWTIRDLTSRNGTLIDNEAIHGERELQPGNALEIAGCQMVFVHDIADAFEQDTSLTASGGSLPDSSVLSEDQMTVEGIEAPQITHRRGKTQFLEQRLRQSRADSQDTGAAQKLFHLAFDLNRCETIDSAAEAALETLIEHTMVTTGAVLRLPEEVSGSANSLVVVATRQRAQRSYHRLPDFVADTVLRDGEAVLARNIHDDSTLASPDSHGEISTTSTICAPVKVDNESVGLIHLYSSDQEPSLEPEHLHFVLAVAENLGLCIQNLQRHAKLATRLDNTTKKVTQLQKQLGKSSTIVGDSNEIRALQETIKLAAPTSSTVLIRGESGVGKELVAQALHEQSLRSEGPFLCLNCAALSPSLLESELFGHEKGAFTGATDRKLGKFEAANGGTLMLDEIGEMSPEIQAKFLRVLEGHPFERVGGNRPIRADVRVISATNRDLENEVREGKFRADLFFRLNVLEILISPLRDRGRDTIRLANHFLSQFCEDMGRKIDGFSEAAQKKMLAYHWPGNVRELRNAVERAVVLCGKKVIDIDDLVLANVSVAGGSPSATTENTEYQELSLSEMEKIHIIQTLRVTGGNKSRAAVILGIERSTLDRKLRRHEVQPREWMD